MRMTNVESFLRGKSISESIFAKAGDLARNDVTPISDVRGSIAYRKSLAANIFSRLYFDLVESGSTGGH